MSIDKAEFEIAMESRGWERVLGGWRRAEPKQASKQASLQSQPEPKAQQGSEADLHEKILDYCQERRWLVVHQRMDLPTTTRKGVLDFIVAMPSGRTLWIECKTKSGKVTPEQAGEIQWLTSLGHHVAVVRSLDEFKTISASGDLYE